MIYRVIKQLITLGRTDGLREKLSVLFVTGDITEEQYLELISLFPAE